MPATQSNIIAARRGNRSRGYSIFGLVWLLAFASIGAYLLLRSGDSTGTSSTQRIAEPVALTTSAGDAAVVDDGDYLPIESIRVGQRVITPETRADEVLPTRVDPATWKLLTLRLTTQWPDGTIDETHVRTVQSPQWLSSQRVAVGAKVAAPLDLTEMGGPPDQLAEVMAIEPCPPIEEGPGRVVLTTVNHLNNYVFDLGVHGQRGPPQTIRVTGWHKLYSATRDSWVSVCELAAGEKLSGWEEPLTVDTLVRVPGTFTVYNMTVEDEHQYYVSTLDVLAHNVSCTAKEGIYTFPDAKGGGVPYVGQSGNVPSRLQCHARNGRLTPGTETVTQVLGGKTAREIEEHNAIQALTGGNKASTSPRVTNRVDPIGPARRPGLGLPEPR